MTDFKLVLAAPGLLSLPADFLVGQRSLARLARYADSARREPAGLEHALCAALSLPDDCGPAPFAAYGAGIPRHELDGTPIAYADPVHLEAGLADVIVNGRITDLTRDESAALIEALNTHLAIGKLVIDEARPDAWFARAANHADVAESTALATTARVLPPECVVGRSMASGLPPGDRAGIRLRWQGEIETLLHAQAANAARAARGAATVDALWFWGGGALSVDEAARGVVSAHAPPGRIGDLVAGIARASRGSVLPWRGPQAGIASLLDTWEADWGLGRASSPKGESPAIAVVAIEPIRSEGDAVAFARDWLAPSLTWLEAHSIGELVLVADGQDSAAVWRARIPGLAARLRARLERPRFSAPVSTDE